MRNTTVLGFGSQGLLGPPNGGLLPHGSPELPLRDSPATHPSDCASSASRPFGTILPVSGNGRLTWPIGLACKTWYEWASRFVKEGTWDHQHQQTHIWTNQKKDQRMRSGLAPSRPRSGEMTPATVYASTSRSRDCTRTRTRTRPRGLLRPPLAETICSSSPKSQMQHTRGSSSRPTRDRTIRRPDRHHRAVPFAVLATVHGLRGIEPQNQSSPFITRRFFESARTLAVNWTGLPPETP